jgi:hypothetical protein
VPWLATRKKQNAAEPIAWGNIATSNYDSVLFLPLQPSKELKIVFARAFSPF